MKGRLVDFSEHPYRCRNPWCVRGANGGAKSIAPGAVWRHAAMFDSVECKGCGVRWLMRIASLKHEELPVLMVQVSRREFQRLRSLAADGVLPLYLKFDHRIMELCENGRFARAAETFAEWVEEVLAR